MLGYTSLTEIGLSVLDGVAYIILGFGLVMFLEWVFKQ